MRNDQTTTRRNPRGGLGRTRVATLCVVALVGSLSLAALAASPAGASKAHKTKKPQSTAAQLVAAENELSAFEAAAPSGVKLSEAGSSLFYPLWAEWQGGNATAGNPPVGLNPAAGGSGKGTSEALSGAINIGASDAFLPASERTGPPAALDIPVVVSAQAVVYNLPSVPVSKHLHITATILNDMYDGAIANWDNKLIAKVNPGVTLPNLAITPVRRSDSSGDTFIFTSYLYYGDKTSWNHPAPYLGPNLFYATWPSVANEEAQNGNTGVVSGVDKTVGAVGYVGVSYLTQTNGDGLGFAALQNGSGNFEVPDAFTISSEIASFTRVPSSGAISLIDSKSAKFGYPITNFEYAIVLQNQPSSTTEAAIKAMLAWGMDPRHGASSAYLDPVNFKQLPLNGIQAAIALLNSLT